MSRVTVRAFASGTLSALNHIPTLAFREFGGTAWLTQGAFEPAWVHIRANAASLTVLEVMSDRNRDEIERTMIRDVLEIEKYPDILFCSSKVSVSTAGNGQYWINLVGDLSLHGVTGIQPISAQVALIGDTLRAYGEFTLLHTTYNIGQISLASAALKLRDEVKCSFDIVARRQQDTQEYCEMTSLSREQT